MYELHELSLFSCMSCFCKTKKQKQGKEHPQILQQKLVLICLPPPKTSSNMMCSLVRGVNGCQLSSMKELHDARVTKKSAGGILAIESADPGNHLLWTPPCIICTEALNNLRATFSTSLYLQWVYTV